MFLQRSPRPKKTLAGYFSKKQPPPAPPPPLTPTCYQKYKIYRYTIWIEKEFMKRPNVYIFSQLLDIFCPKYQKFWRRLRGLLILLFRKKINKLVLFTCRNLYRFHICLNYREAFLATWKTRLLQTHIEKFSQHIWTFRLTNLQNRSWNKMNSK